jgi:hypothetical protein
MDDKFVWFPGGVFFGPADNKLLSLTIQIPLVKWGGIHRIEDLLEGLDLYLDQLVFGIHRH